MKKSIRQLLKDFTLMLFFITYLPISSFTVVAVLMISGIHFESFVLIFSYIVSFIGWIFAVRIAREKIRKR